MDTVAKGVLALSIVVFLIVTNPWVALGAVTVLGLLYGTIYGFVRPRLMRYGAELRESNRIRYKAAAEAFGAIKDVKILGKEPTLPMPMAWVPGALPVPRQPSRSFPPSRGKQCNPWLWVSSLRLW